MNIPEASQVAELIQKLHSIAVHINDRHNHSNLPPVAMGWCEEAIDFLRLYLEAGKEVPEEIHGKHENCFDIDMGYCVTHGEDVDIHPEYMRGFNSARSQFIPLLMAEKAKSAEKDREIERLNNIELAKAITDIPKNGTGILLSEKSYNALKSQLASAQEREKWFDSLVEYKIKGKFKSLRAYVEYLEAIAERVRVIGAESKSKLKEALKNDAPLNRVLNDYYDGRIQKAIVYQKISDFIHALYNPSVNDEKGE